MTDTNIAPPWPKRPDGSNMTMGEMTPEQRREQFRAAARRLQFEFDGKKDALARAFLRELKK